MKNGVLKLDIPRQKALDVEVKKIKINFDFNEESRGMSGNSPNGKGLDGSRRVVEGKAAGGGEEERPAPSGAAVDAPRRSSLALRRTGSER